MTTGACTLQFSEFILLSDIYAWFSLLMSKSCTRQLKCLTRTLVFSVQGPTLCYSQFFFDLGLFRLMELESYFKRIKRNYLWKKYQPNLRWRKEHQTCLVEMTFFERGTNVTTRLWLSILYPSFYISPKKIKQKGSKEMFMMSGPELEDGRGVKGCQIPKDFLRLCVTGIFLRGVKLHP